MRNTIAKKSQAGSGLPGWVHNASFLTSLLLGGVTIIVALGIAEYVTTAYFQRKSDTAYAIRSTAHEIQQHFLSAERAGRDFLLDDLASQDFHAKGVSANLTAHEVAMAALRADLEKLRELLGGELQQDLAMLERLTDEYGKSFVAIVALHKEKGFKDWGVEGEWRRVVHAVERDPQLLRDRALETQLLRVRRAEKDYLLRGEDRYRQDALAEVEKLRTMAAALPSGQSGRLVEDLKQYERLFREYWSLQDKLGRTPSAGLRGVLGGVRQQMEPLLEDVFQYAAAGAESARLMLGQIGIGILVLGALAAGIFFYFFARAMARPLGELREAVEAVGTGKLDTRVDFVANNEFGTLARGFNHMVEQLTGIIGHVQRAGIQVSTSVTEIVATANEQQATATEIAATTTEIGATSKEISATSKELLNTITEVSGAAEQTASVAGDGQQGLTRMEDTMRHVAEAASSINSKLIILNEKAGNINQVVTTITKIADQTNLLSLNAAIEAEKAGEAGRGFAVVATEIRRLADQTAVATFDIEQTVKEIQSAVAAGVMGMDKFTEEVRRGIEEVRNVGGQLTQIIQQVQAVAPRIVAVSDGMQAQATGAEQISDALAQLTEASQQTVQSLRQSSEAINGLNQVSSGLHSAVTKFKLQNAAAA